MKTLTWRALLLLVATTAFVGTSGFLISKLKVEKSAFGKTKRYAVVSVVGANKITTDSQSGGLMGGLKGISKDKDFSAESTPVLEAAPAVIEKELAKSKSFTLVPASQVMRHSAFSKAEGDKARSFMGMKLVAAPGYQYFKSEKKLAKLAANMGVDGVIVVNASYSVGFTGVTVGGLVGGGKQYGMGTIAVGAVDRNGKTVWSQAKMGKGKGSGSIGGAADFKKMQPQFLEATKLATAELVGALDEKLGTK
jgi:hypothetical protein